MRKVRSDTRSLAETLQAEKRTCLRCRLVVESPFVEKCPRCFTRLPAIDVNCDGCVHKILCPTGKNRKFKF